MNNELRSALLQIHSLAYPCNAVVRRRIMSLFGPDFGHGCMQGFGNGGHERAVPCMPAHDTADGSFVSANDFRE